MPQYQAPLRDMRFVFHELFQAGEKLQRMGFEDASDDLVDAILEEGAKFCQEVLTPLNQPGDQQGCGFHQGQVSTPEGFKEAYQAFTEGGWTSLSADPEYGGQGLPDTLAFLLEEMLCSSNVSFSLYPGLTRGAYNALYAHAAEELKGIYLPKMVSGEWAGTMCLTEPHAGTDLGLLRTKAEPLDNGRYAITGTKIFITGGEQDLTDNIVHLVLARTPDAPAGIAGVSLFLVPKFKLNDQGEPGEANGVSCGSIEHKMGIKGSATCVMNFDAAEGHLVGQLNKGVACMFTMMNTERLAIGMQGVGLAEVAYQNAVDYARERIQGRANGAPQSPDKAADSILVHPDVRRMLLTTRAYNEGARALASWVALLIDTGHRHPDAVERGKSDDLVALLTPIVKAFFSDYGFETTVLCQQVLGGHGYIQEWGMEQFVRDARIAQIYEGTNGVQALDLAGRKLSIKEGALPEQFFLLAETYFAEQSGNAELQEFLAPAQESLGRLRELTQWLREAGKADADEIGAASVEYLRLFALTVLAYLWTRMAEVALANKDGEEAEFYRTKLATGRFFIQRLLPHSLGLEASIRNGAASLMALSEDRF